LTVSALLLSLNLISLPVSAAEQSIEDLKIELQTLSGADRMYALLHLRSKTNIGRTFFLQRDFESAEENLKSAFDLNVEIREPLHTAIINENLGDLYLGKEIFGKARSHYKKALETRSAMNG